MSKSLQTTKRNYGVLTEVSKGWNIILGDKSGRTVSRRTAHGFKNTFGLKQMNDDSAEDVVHFGMVSAAVLLFTKDKRAITFAVMLILILVVFYQMGKNSQSH